MIELDRISHTRRAAAGTIPPHRSFFPRPHTSLRIVAAAALAGMVVILADVPTAHAQSADVTAEPAVTLAQAAPSGPPPGIQDVQRPPREAMEACAAVPLDAGCSFAGREGDQITGTCRSPEADVPAACVPADMPPNG